MSTNFPKNPYDQQRYIDGINLWTWYETEQIWKVEKEYMLSNTSVTGTFFSSENI